MKLFAVHNTEHTVALQEPFRGVILNALPTTRRCGPTRKLQPAPCAGSATGLPEARRPGTDPEHRRMGRSHPSEVLTYRTGTFRAKTRQDCTRKRLCESYTESYRNLNSAKVLRLRRLQNSSRILSASFWRGLCLSSHVRPRYAVDSARITVTNLSLSPKAKSRDYNKA